MAVVAVLPYLMAVLTMEVNYFRLAVYRSWWRRQRQSRGRVGQGGGGGLWSIIRERGKGEERDEQKG
jgi:hypothetical protein